MILVLAFVLVVLAYSLLSRWLERTMLTGPIVFTLAGIGTALALPALGPSHGASVSLHFAEVGLVMLLSTDAARLEPSQLRRGSALPARLLVIAMPLSLVAGTALAWWMLPLSLLEAAILAAILVPTDAGLGQVVVSDSRVPQRVREALNIEAGLNDGLAVPFLLFFIAAAAVPSEGAYTSLGRYVVEQLGYGSIVGAAVGLAGGSLLGQATRRNWMSGLFAQAGVMALPILCLLLAEMVSASMFIAAFVAGLCVPKRFPDAGRHSLEFSEVWGQVLSLSVFFLFGLAVVHFRADFTLQSLAYAVVSLTVVRMLPVFLSLTGSGLDVSTQLFMGWFGPRGLASIVLGLVYLEREIPLAGEATIRTTTIMTVLLSIGLHGMTARPGIALLAAGKTNRASPPDGSKQ